MSIGSANQECLRRIHESTAVLVDVRLARDVIPGMGDRTVLHAGPPITWDRMCGPMRGAISGACVFEGWVKTPEEGLELAASGALEFDSCHNHRSVGPMSGIITPSMAVHVIRNDKFGIETYANLYEGIGKVLRHGANDQAVIDRLRWMHDEMAPVLTEAVRRSGGIDIKSLVAEALQMGDEMHNRNRACSSRFILALVPHMVAIGKGDMEKIITFMDSSSHICLNSVMASCKAMLDAGHGIADSTIVTAMARNGTDFGIRVSGLGDHWFTAPSPMVDGVYFPGYGPEDANPDLGDSAIAETAGLGSLAMAGAPAVVQYVGGTAKFAIETTQRMYEITAGEHETFRIPNLNFRGTPIGIDIRRVVETGITPVINTGIAHKKAGIGQIGAGLTAAPLECFVKALEAFAETRGVTA
ncbi:MAG: DUF1116 domain-containing protein [Rhodospirillales bacterium]|nr:DUF1116 domain-containing protein [Rhodospirillales bacterium]